MERSALSGEDSGSWDVGVKGWDQHSSLQWLPSAQSHTPYLIENSVSTYRMYAYIYIYIFHLKIKNHNHTGEAHE